MLEFNQNKIVGQLKIDVTEADIENIMVSCFEGGSNHWMGLDNDKPEWKVKPSGEPLATWATKLLLEGSSIKFFDVERTEDDSDWILTLDKLIKSVGLNAINRPHDSNLENGDTTTCDCIMQFALFGKVEFG